MNKDKKRFINKAKRQGMTVADLCRNCSLVPSIESCYGCPQVVTWGPGKRAEYYKSPTFGYPRA